MKDWGKSLLKKSDGTKIKAAENKEYEISRGGGFSLFPDGTSVKAAIDEAKWSKDKDGNERISLRWFVIAPDEYKDRKVFQNLWVADLEPNEVKRGGEEKAEAKRDRAREMFAVIDANAGGRIAELIEDDIQIKDEQLMANLTNKAMVIRIDLMVPKTGDPMNFVSKVSPKTAAVSTPEEIERGKAEIAGIKKSAAPSASSRTLDDEIPF